MAVSNSVVYVDGAVAQEGADPAEALAYARANAGMLWIGLISPNDDDVQAIGELLELNHLGVLESQRDHERSKLEQYGDELFLVLQPAQYDDAAEEVHCHEVDVFVGEDFIVTIVRDDVFDTGAVRQRLERHPELLERGSYIVLWALLEWVTRGYRGVLDGIEDDIDQIEEQIFSEDAHVSHRIFGLQREVIDLHHATAPLVDMLDRLQKIVQEREGTADAPAFREIDDRARYVEGRVVAFRQTLDNALTVNSTLVDARRNEEMRKLTEFGLQQNDQVKKISAWAAILFAPTLVGTVYGMNFDHMPELHWALGYPMALGLMLATSITLYTVFKKRDWL